MNYQSIENDLSPADWKKYEDNGLEFYSIWDFNKRDPLGIIPFNIRGSMPYEVIKQCLLRFTKENDFVLDPFCGAGTTLIGCGVFKRNGIGIELNEKIFQLAKKNLENAKNRLDSNSWITRQKIINGDSLKWMGNHIKSNSFDFIFAHPPYWNLIKYGQDYQLKNESNVNSDISLCSNLNEFLSKIELLFQSMYRILKDNKYLCVLIGDTFISEKETIPLDYYFTKIALESGFNFYSKIIKVTRNANSKKYNVENYKKRSIKSNFLICIHDYLLVFKK